MASFGLGCIRRIGLGLFFIAALPGPGWGTAALGAEVIWVVGDRYVARYENKQLSVYEGVKPGSWGFDSAACRVWIADEESKKLWAFSPEGKAEKGEASAVLSPVTGEGFLTRGVDGQLEVRDAEGNVGESHGVDWVKDSLAAFVEPDRAWSLQYTPAENRLSLLVLGSDWSVKTTSVFPTAKVIWANHRIVRDPQAGDFWVGYTTSAPGLSSGSHIERRGHDGALLASFQVKERGYFFDLCVDRDGAALVARDIPSDSGFTVPFNAYLERVAPSGQVSRVYTTSTNDFIDAVECRGDSVWMAQRSIFGSDGSHLVRWDRKAGDLGETLVRLPGRGVQVFACRP